MNEIIRLQRVILELEAIGCWHTAKVLREWLAEMWGEYESLLKDAA